MAVLFHSNLCFESADDAKLIFDKYFDQTNPDSIKMDLKMLLSDDFEKLEPRQKRIASNMQSAPFDCALIDLTQSDKYTPESPYTTEIAMESYAGAPVPEILQIMVDHADMKIDANWHEHCSETLREIEHDLTKVGTDDEFVNRCTNTVTGDVEWECGLTHNEMKQAIRDDFPEFTSLNDLVKFRARMKEVNKMIDDIKSTESETTFEK